MKISVFICWRYFAQHFAYVCSYLHDLDMINTLLLHDRRPLMNLQYYTELWMKHLFFGYESIWFYVTLTEGRLLSVQFFAQRHLCPVSPTQVNAER